MNSTVSSAAALVAALITAVALAFVWGGTESVSVEWRAMADDYGQGELMAKLTPSDTEPTEYTSTAAAMPTRRDGEKYVLWLNISGFRGDYIEESETPFFDKAVSEGYSTNRLLPAFPSLEYPTLISQATGKDVSAHGIASDVLRHPETKEIVARPTDLSLLKAEPIWTTAKRQGLRVLVHDWPLSQKQPAENAADIFLSEYDPSLSDEDRLNRLFDAWSSDQNEKKLRLIMANLHDINKAGQDYGCREEETHEAVSKLDKTLQAFMDKVEGKWTELSNPGDRLFVIMTTDHGMHDADKLINFQDLMGNLTDKINYAIDQAVAHIWFKDADGPPSQDFIDEFDDELSKRIYWRSFAAGDYPSMWKFGEGGPHVGDRLLVLKPGYAFTEKKGSEAVFPPAETSGPFSTSGFFVQDQTRMKGQAIIYEMGGGGSGSTLGEIDSTVLHATVANLLGIQPAEGANSNALKVD